MNFYEQQVLNKRKTYFLFLILFFLILFLGLVISWYFEDYVFVPIFGIFSVIYIVITYYYSQNIIVAISGAKKATIEKYKQLHNIVEEISIAAGLPKPEVYVIEDSAINAFATGRDPQHSIVCVTTGALEKLNREELTGVVAHEISHIKNYDTRVMTLAAVMVGLVVLVSDFLIRMFLWGGEKRESKNSGGILLLIIAIIFALLTPIIAQIIKLAISRSREYLADASAAELTRYPEGLASALEKIKNDDEILEAANKATAHLYISDPLKGQRLFLRNLFSTHPPIEDRIEKLRSM